MGVYHINKLIDFRANIIVYFLLFIIIFITFINLITGNVSKINKMVFILFPATIIGYAKLEEPILWDYHPKQVRSIENIFKSRILYLIISSGFIYLIHCICLIIYSVTYEMNVSEEFNKLYPLISVIIVFSAIIFIPMIVVWIYTGLELPKKKNELE